MLSKIIIFVTRHNLKTLGKWRDEVVNCFQKLLSSWHDTTWFIYGNSTNGLWIAFKNYYLRDTTQQGFEKVRILPGCELLSKIIIFVTRHNLPKVVTVDKHVVNCFQKLLSSWHDTTTRQNSLEQFLLWIAFKNYYLRDTTQRNFLITELKTVVNCFQKLLSSWHDTTSTNNPLKISGFRGWLEL